MTDPAHSQTYRPIGEEPSGASSLFRHVLPLLVVALIGVAFLRPDWLRGRLPAGVDPAALGA